MPARLRCSDTDLGVWLRAGIRGQCIQNATYPSHLCTFPSYLDPRYQTYFLRAIDRFAQHIGSLPHSVRSKIVASQAMYGTTGDDEPWHGNPVDPKQIICYTPEMKPCKRVGEFADEWHNFTMSTAPAICASYARVGINVLCELDWLLHQLLCSPHAVSPLLRLQGTRHGHGSRSCARSAVAASSRQV
jgi:hypothetical protein